MPGLAGVGIRTQAQSLLSLTLRQLNLMRTRARAQRRRGRGHMMAPCYGTAKICIVSCAICAIAAGPVLGLADAKTALPRPLF